MNRKCISIVNSISSVEGENVAFEFFCVWMGSICNWKIMYVDWAMCNALGREMCSSVRLLEGVIEEGEKDPSVIVSSPRGPGL